MIRDIRTATCDKCKSEEKSYSCFPGLLDNPMGGGGPWRGNIITFHVPSLRGASWAAEEVDLCPSCAKALQVVVQEFFALKGPSS